MVGSPKEIDQNLKSKPEEKLEKRGEGDGRATLAHFLGVNSKEEFFMLDVQGVSPIYSL